MNKIVSEINDLFETKLCCEELVERGVIPDFYPNLSCSVIFSLA